MLNRDQIALNLLPSLIATAGNDNTLVVGHAFEIADEYIEAVNQSKERPAVVGDGWISVDDRMPEENIRVLLFDADVGALSGRHLGKYWYLEGEKDKGACITHWQPLPNPPKGVTK